MSDEERAITIADQLKPQQLEALGIKSVDEAVKKTVQSRVEAGVDSTAPFYMWFRKPVDEWDVSPWWSKQRDSDLRDFVHLEGNDILAGAVSSMVKKFKAMNWVVDGPKTTTKWAQELLSEADFGKGWSTLLGKVIEDYLTQDVGAFIEVIGDGRQDKPLTGLPVGIAHMDAALCIPTSDPEYPVLFYGNKDGKPRKIHATRVVRIVDMESPNEAMAGVGWCAVSRVVASSQLLLFLNKYRREKLEDLPPAGLLLLSNIVPSKWEDAQAEYERDRRKRGQDIWASVMTFIGVAPDQEAKAQFVNFSQMPEHFDEQTTITNYINIIAMAMGIDARELWPVSSGALGTAAESLIMHTKAKGKGVGELISAVERAINWKVLPSRVTFSFDFKDDDEDEQSARINQARIDSIMKMYVPDPTTGETVVSRMEVRQMLADNTDYFLEDFLEVDLTGDVEATDTDQEEDSE